MHELQKNTADNDETQVSESQGTQGQQCFYICKQVVSGLILNRNKMDCDDIYSISIFLDTRFKEIPFSALALDKTKKLLFTLIRRINLGEVHGSKNNSINIITDDEDPQAGMPELVG